MKALDRAGIFKARLLGWAVKETDSGSVSVNLRLLILAHLDGDDWVPWDPETVEEHVVYSDSWVIKRDGSVNDAAVEQLVQAIGWDGSLASVVGEAPSVVVQVTVKEDVYKGVTRYKGSWINPEHYAPEPFGESAEDVRSLQARYGSLLRASAAGAKRATAAPAKKAAPPPAKAKAPPATANVDDPGNQDDDNPLDL